MKTVGRGIGILLAALALVAGIGRSARAEETPIRIAYPSGLNGLVIKVLEKAKIAEKHGLKPEYSFFQYGPPMMEAIAAESIDAASTSVVPVSSFLTKKPGSVVIVANLGFSSHGLIVQPDSGVASLKDLKGKTIAASFNSESHVDLLVALKEAGLDPASDVTLLNIAPNELAAVFRTKQADAAIIRQPQLLKLEEKHEAKVVARWPHRYLGILRAEYIKAHPDAPAKFQAALREAIHYIAQNPDQAAEWFGEHLRVEPALVKKTLAEDPNFAVKSADEIQVGITPAFKKQVQDRLVTIEQLKLLKSVPEILYSEGK